MTRSRLRIKVLGLCAVVLGLMAFGASAQAEVGANWMVNGSNVTVSLTPSIDVTDIENKTGSFLTKIAGASVTYLCTGAHLIGIKLEPAGKAGSGKGRVTGCVTILNGTMSSGCAPRSAGLPFGEIESLGVKGLSALHEGQGLIRLEPEVAGGNFAVLEHDPKTCSLPEKVPIRGIFFLKDCKNEGKVELVTHLAEQNSLTHIYVISDTIEHAASVDGSVNVALIGVHAGLKWSGLPA